MSALIEPLSAATFRMSPPAARLQTTLRSEISHAGIGMHTGLLSRVTVRPAAQNRGITFISGSAVIPAVADSVVNTHRCTCLGIGECQVFTVEHLLSALAGLEVDNAEIVVDGAEIPILDGSARPWVEALESAGVVELDEPVRIAGLTAPVVLSSGESWLIAIPSDAYTITCVTSFDHALLGTEVVTYRQSPQAFVSEVAPARTFGFIEEVEALLSSGLAQGGSLENALIVYPDRFSGELRIPHECSRHKLMDVIGDLSLTGVRIHATITAVKPSHRANVEFARLLTQNLAV